MNRNLPHIVRVTVLILIGPLIGAFIGTIGGIIATETLSGLVANKSGIAVECFWGFGIMAGFGLGTLGGFLYALIFAPVLDKIPVLIHIAMTMGLGGALGFALPRFYQPACILMLGQSDAAWLTAKAGAVCAVCYGVIISLLSRIKRKNRTED